MVAKVLFYKKDSERWWDEVGESWKGWPIVLSEFLNGGKTDWDYKENGIGVLGCSWVWFDFDFDFDGELRLRMTGKCITMVVYVVMEGDNKGGCCWDWRKEKMMECCNGGYVVWVKWRLLGLGWRKWSWVLFPG